MELPVVVNVKKAFLKERDISDFTEWQAKDGNLYIGRNMDFYVKGAKKSKWCNPFSVKKYGLNECLRLYEEHVRKNLMESLEELRDVKELGCWCKPEKCHGDILRKLLEETK